MRGAIPLLLFAVALVVVAGAPSQHDQPFHLKEQMKASDFEQCGLHRLTESELGLLDAWLAAYSTRLVEKAAGSALKEGPDVIESNIEGEFEGWDGDTIFKLDNGQIWQQVSYDYTYHYAYHPEVLIYKTGGGYKMKVEDVDDTIYVRKLK